MRTTHDQMTSPIRIVHYVNQFFGGIGGEERADTELLIREHPVGPGVGIARALGERGRIVATLIGGDNYFTERMDVARSAALEAIERYRPDVVIAGPAFNAGRYGMACGEVCKAVTETLRIPSVTAMSPHNPAVSLYRRSTYILPTGESAASMPHILPRLTAFAHRLAIGDAIGPAEREGYMPRGIRGIILDERSAAQRAAEMLKAKLTGEPYQTEIPVEVFQPVSPAAPLQDLTTATIALVTTSGLVPRGNPDGFKSMNESRWATYPVKHLDALAPDEWEPIHGGYDARFARENPNRVVPLDVLRELENEGVIGRLHADLIVTVGVGTPVEVCQRMGEEIVDELHRANVSAAIFTSN